MHGSFVIKSVVLIKCLRMHSRTYIRPQLINVLIFDVDLAASHSDRDFVRPILGKFQIPIIYRVPDQVLGTVHLRDCFLLFDSVGLL